MTQGTSFSVEVNPRIPPRLARLEELANNLWYSWDLATRALFRGLDRELWDATAHCPKALLKYIDEERLVAAAADPVFLNSFNRVLSAFDAYQTERLHRPSISSFERDDLVAYFCAEFGFHESFPLYSGGLGILAGDHCKAASDYQIPFVATGLLYRQGYFVQTIDGEGNQRAQYFDSEFSDLPITPVQRIDGSPLQVELAMPGRTVFVRVWRTRIGHVSLYLLDSDVPANSDDDRGITHRLYGGDRRTRLEQEIVLGVGGVRALAAMGLRPTIWHINEGHAAFLVLERIRGMVREGHQFDTALEAVASNTIFTTHTGVPAGHDQFPDRAIEPYLEAYCKELGLGVEKVVMLARPPGGGDFNMTTLAMRGSRYHNGVSRIHAGVTSRMLKDYWPQVPEEESPITSITNGVHVTTFLAPEWTDAFDRFLGIGWMHRLDNPGTMNPIEDIPDHLFWSIRQDLKAQLLREVHRRVRRQHFRSHGSEAHLDRLLRFANPSDPNVLTIGFARRFATYKRATLLFKDFDALRQIVGDASRPILFIFAGKAHPADEPGQDLIRAITHVSRMPEFEGRIMFVEGYDLHLARRLVTGVDVWLNNPVYPLEACGTSGMKAGMNGVINLSVLDGWWDEGYDGENGWAIKPASSVLDPERRDREESQTLYEILRYQALPMYYERSTMGHSPRWIRMAKRSMATLLPRFNTARMLNEYVNKFYVPASRQGRKLGERDFEGAKTIAAWKERVRTAWPGVSARRLDDPQRRIPFGGSIPVEVAVRLNGLTPEDIAVELLHRRNVGDSSERRRTELAASGAIPETGECRFALEWKPEICGRVDYRIRIYPRHALSTHPHELGLMLWL